MPEPPTTDEARQTITENVRRVMRDRRVTGLALAARIGRKNAALHRRLSGQVPFDADELLRIAAVLECDVRELYGLMPAEDR